MQTNQKSNRKMVQRGQIDTPHTHTHTRTHTRTHAPTPNEMTRSCKCFSHLSKCHHSHIYNIVIKNAIILKIMGNRFNLRDAELSKKKQLMVTTIIYVIGSTQKPS